MGKSGSRGAWPFIAAGLLVAATAGGYLAYRAGRGTSGPVAYHPTTAPATQPDKSDDPSTRPTSKPAPPTTTFIDVVRATYPKYSTTRPLDTPLRDLADAARIHLTDPVYLSPPGRADLWITRKDGLPTQAALKRALDTKEYPQVHVVPERVRFVHWHPGERVWQPFVVCDPAEGSTDFELVSLNRRATIPAKQKYDWSRAYSWNERIIVPSEDGVSIFRFTPELTEDYRALIGPMTPHAPPQTLLDWQGLLAWVPAEDGKRGSTGAARYVDGKWEPLGTEQGWPEQILHLIPLRDGSVRQLVAGADGAVSLGLAVLDNKVEVDEKAIVALVEQMSDPDQERRDAALKELLQYGRGIYTILENLVNDQPPEARARLRSLMKSQVQPTLGGMSLAGNKLLTVTRHADGGVVFYAPEGVTISRDEGEPTRQAPAWIAIRPGRAVELVDASLVRELKPDGCELIPLAGEWIVTGDAAGPRRWVGNGFVPLLRKDEAEFSQPVGVDRLGRWIFRKPATGKTSEEILVLDPRLPDPVPRLPYWEYTTAREFGWDAEGWPVVRREGGDWSIRERGWKLLDPLKKEHLLSVVPTTKPTSRPTTRSVATTTTTRSTTSPTTRPQPNEPTILVDADGNSYYDGLSTLRVIHPDGGEFTWPLPAATGTGPVTLLKTADGLLFLFNQPGRVLRIRPTPGDAEPFNLEATFTRKIPSVAKPKRIWLDPAGRIVMRDAARVLIFFPQGYIPTHIRDLMPLERAESQP